MSQTDFHPVILKKGDSFCVFLPEWGLSGEGASLEAAYRQFEERKRELEERREKFGLATIAAEPYPPLKHSRLLQELGLFFAKVATAAFAVVFVTILVLPHITAAIRHHFLPRMDDALNRYALELPAKINARLDRVTPEQEKQIAEEWGKLWKRTSRLRSAFSEGAR